VVILTVFATRSSANQPSEWLSCADDLKLIMVEIPQTTSWDRLAEFTDTFGPRLSGSSSLEDAITWVENQMKLDGLDNVHTEDVKWNTEFNIILNSFSRLWFLFG
jgi:hypothetical protein